MKMLLFGKTRTLNQKIEIYIGQETIWKGTRYYDPKVKVSLSKNWQEVLKTEYKVQVIDFEENEVLIDEHVEGNDFDPVFF